MKIADGYTVGSEPAREVSASRLIDAPRDLVFAAFSDREHIGEWWGPNGFSTTTSKMDFRPGGRWEFIMHGPDGRDYDNRVVFDRIEKPELLMWHHTGEGEGVNHHTIFTFEEKGSSTLVTLYVVFSDAAERDRLARDYGVVEGATQNLQRLGEYVTK